MEDERSRVRAKLFGAPDATQPFQFKKNRHDSVSEETRRIREHIFGKPTSFDALSLALAQTQSRRFTSDPHSWNQVIHSLQDELKEQTSSLLNDFLFDMRRPDYPTSDQTRQFLAHLRRSDALVLWSNNSEGEYEMPEKAKEDIKENQRPMFEKEEAEIMRIAEALDENLGIKTS